MHKPCTGLSDPFSGGSGLFVLYIASSIMQSNMMKPKIMQATAVREILTVVVIKAWVRT
jgi:hypothetical protein